MARRPQIEENARFQHREWRVMRIAWMAVGVVLLAAIAVAALMPAGWQIRLGLHWLVEHFLAFFTVTLVFCLAWPRPMAVAALLLPVAILIEGLQALTPDRTLRMGYIYHRNPIPNDTLTPFIQATLEHAVSAGYGWKCTPNWTIDAAYQFSFGPDNNVGTSSIVGGDFSSSRNESQVHWLFLSAIRTL